MAKEGYDLRGFDRFVAEVDKGVKKSGGMSTGTPGGNKPMDDLFKQIAVRYLAFVRRRFVKYSRGGGDWPDLKRSTKMGRRSKFKKKGRRRNKAQINQTLTAGRFAILRDTGLLFSALSFGNPGNLYKKIPYGIRVGFGGPTKHHGGKATIADIAGYHNTGEGNMPKREIIVEPDSSLHEKLQRDLKTAMSRIAKKHEMKE